MPPGPARSGMARGKTEMSCWYCSSSCSRTALARIPEGLAKTMSSRVTNALNTNSMGQDCTLQRGARIRDYAPLVPQLPRPLHGLLADPDLRGPVPPAHLLRERPDHHRNVRRQVPNAPWTERQPEKAVEAFQDCPDLLRLRDQEEGFEARCAARDPLGQPGVLDSPRAAGAHGVGSRAELAFDLATLRFDPYAPECR